MENRTMQAAEHPPHQLREFMSRDTLVQRTVTV